jgi:hypothetical protein
MRRIPIEFSPQRCTASLLTSFKLQRCIPNIALIEAAKHGDREAAEDALRPSTDPNATIDKLLRSDQVASAGRGDLILSELTAAGYHEISRTHLLDPTSDYAGRKMAWSAPAYANRCVFARSDKELVCASLAAGPSNGRATKLEE